MTRPLPNAAVVGPMQDDTGELVFSGEVPADASIVECLRLAWEEARLGALASYDEWHATRERSAYFVYRAAQDRADAAQDALAHVGRSPGRHGAHHTDQTLDWPTVHVLYLRDRLRSPQARFELRQPYP